MVTTDLDRSMKGSKRAESLYLGPSLGLTNAQQNILNVTTGGTTAIDRNVTLVQVNFAGAVTIQLPSTLNVNPNLGTLVMEGVEIVDISGAAGANNITILPAAGELIIGIASIIITANYGSYTLGPISTGGWSLLNQNPSSIGTATFETRAAVQAAFIPVLTQGIQTMGYSAVGDGGAALYKKVGAEPVHEGKVQSADGAWWEIASAVLSVKQFNAAGDNVTDDSPTFQDAVVCAQSQNKPLFIPTGIYRWFTEVPVTSTLVMYGVDIELSCIRVNGDTQNGIVVACSGMVHFSGFRIEGTTTATAGDLISVSGAGGQYNHRSLFRDVWFIDGWNQLHMYSAAEYVVDNCNFSNFLHRGCICANDISPDAGGIVVSNSIFATAGVTGTGLEMNSAGALRVVNNEFISMINAITLDFADGIVSTVATIVGNTIENLAGTAVELIKRGTGTHFVSLQVSANEISRCGFGVLISQDTGPWTYHVEVVGNSILTNVTNGVGILIYGTESFSVIGNSIRFVDAAAPSIGIAIGSFSAKGTVANNNIVGYSTPINNASLSTRIEGNNGYNPVGSSSVSPGASPWTFTAGGSPVTLYISSDTGISSITNGGVEILPVAIAAASMRPFYVDPNDSLVITYTGTLTATKTIH